MSGGIDVFPPSGGNQSKIVQLYHTFVDMSKNLTSAPDINLSPASATTYTYAGMMMAKNITIGANATVQTSYATQTNYAYNGSGYASDTTLLIVCDTLTLNGVINASGSSNTGLLNYSGMGGNGGGGVIIIARQIIGTGTVKVNGGNGVNASTTAPGGSNQYNNSAMPVTLNGLGWGGGGTYGLYTTNAGVPGGVANKSIEVPLRFPVWIEQVLRTATIYTTQNNEGMSLTNILINGATGGVGSYALGSYWAIGGSGGAAPYNNYTYGFTGGQGAIPSATGTGNAGGGGGGGGALFILSESPIPALTLQANGGNGGNAGNGNAGGGGGGQGGYIGLWTPSSSATTSVTGGTAGTSLGTMASNSAAGSNGLVDIIRFVG